jgi:hypothetical protein
MNAEWLWQMRSVIAVRGENDAYETPLSEIW